MGGEFGQRREWDHESSLDWHLFGYALHKGLQRLVRDLNRMYREEPALYEIDHDWPGFQWIDFRDAAQSVIAFLRNGKDPDHQIVCACNFTPVPRDDYRIGVPRAGYYRELLNTDASIYGGGNTGNQGGLQTQPVPCHEFPCSLQLTVPRLAVLFLKADANACLPNESSSPRREYQER